LVSSADFILTKADVEYIHQEEIVKAGGINGVRDKDGVIACVEAPKSSFDGAFLYDIYEMATAYLFCFLFRHPFLDGNKRVALASCLTFLYLNGIEIREDYDLELADIILAIVIKEYQKEEFIEFLKARSST
jgi:death-on-curing protein